MLVHLGGIFMNIYEVNVKTSYLEGFIDSDGLVKTRVYENKKPVIINASPTDVMKYSCEYFGSTLEGRQHSSMRLLEVKHKVPIIVEESLPLIFFPLCSPKISICSWICFNNISSFVKSHRGTTIYFNNGLKIDIKMSMGMFENQFVRATRLKMANQVRKIKK